jgi:hypothetical protein
MLYISGLNKKIIIITKMIIIIIILHKSSYCLILNNMNLGTLVGILHGNVVVPHLPTRFFHCMKKGRP